MRGVGVVVRATLRCASRSGGLSTVAKEAMAIMLGNKTGLSIEKFFESPFQGLEQGCFSHEPGATRAGPVARFSSAREAPGRAGLSKKMRPARFFRAGFPGASGPVPAPVYMRERGRECRQTRWEVQ